MPSALLPPNTDYNTYEAVQQSGTYYRRLFFNGKGAGGTHTFNQFTNRPVDTGVQLTDISPKWHVLEVNWDRNSSNNGGTLTYKLDNITTSTGATSVTHQITWTDAEIKQIFRTIYGGYQTKLYVGFSGTTGSNNFEDNVMAFRTLPNIVNATGTVKLTRTSAPTGTVTDSTVLHTNDKLNYHFNIAYDGANSSQGWPNSGTQIKLVIPKKQYFVSAANSVTLTGSDGSTATGTVDNSDPNNIVITAIPPFASGVSKSLSFDLPVAVDATSLTKGNPPIKVSDSTGTFSGDNAQIHAENQAQTSDIFSIQYQIENQGDPFVPPAQPELTTVPDLHFMNTARFFTSGMAGAKATVSELIHGAYTHSDDVQQSATDNTSNLPKLPYISSSDDLTAIIDPSNYNPNGPQLLTAAYNDLTVKSPTNPSLEIDGNRTASNWNLSLQLSQFKTSDAIEKPLPRPARITFVSLSGIGTGLPASYLPNPTNASHPVIVTDGASAPTTIMTSSTAQTMQSIGSNISGDGGFKSGALMGFLYFDQPLPTVQAGSYTSTATWTLSTTP